MERLLYISHRVPFPPDKGERVRAFHEIRSLAGRFRVTLACLIHSPADRQAAANLSEWCEKVILAPAGGKVGLLRGTCALLCGKSVTEGYFRSPRMRRLLAEEAHREPFDLVFAYCSSVLPLALGVPAKGHVIDLVDVDSAKWQAYARDAFWPLSWLYRLEARAVRRLERQAVEQCDAVFLVSEAEARVLGPAGTRTMGVCNGVDSEYFSPSACLTLPEHQPAGPSLAFVGQMDYRPNVDAVCWFASEVWPRLTKELPELRFTIVGRDPARPVQQLARLSGVTVTGTVPDVRPHLASATAVIVPLRIARGIQNKILEAMAMGKAVVASPEALEGLDLRIGRDALQADSPDEWTRRIIDLVRDPAARQALERSARQRVVEDYAWAQQMAPLVGRCRELAQHGAEPDGSAAGAGPRGRLLLLLTGLYALLLAVGSLLPSGGALGGWDRSIEPTVQNAMHVPAYTGLAVLAMLWLVPPGRPLLPRAIWIALGCTAYGLALEAGQAFIPGRTGGASDALLNAAGAAIGIVVHAVASRRLRPRPPVPAGGGVSGTT